MLSSKLTTMSNLDPTTIASILSKGMEMIANKINVGKKLSANELIILYLSMLDKRIENLSSEVKEMNDGIKEMKATLNGIVGRVEEMSKRIDGMTQQIIEMNKQIIEIYRFLAGARSSAGGP